VEENMTPTPWEIRNKLLAILNDAQHRGKPYVDVESVNLHGELGSDPRSKLRIPICHEIMTRMMRPGDVILKETSNGSGAKILIRYRINPEHEH
jgi:hypothetical protein